ncbi:hypothetical protein M0638_16865 [Roseomonas sp. NAR14]|uniref:Uncharacterized protein n=1 Tax=Roseomonas acroporae TaxID=2937791 RepID=A0A9X1Y9L8_9PROT|nr:hypothetical protein [Roseomonas acroporae]MCK8786051.1 hypothetical protein [Roseomonas acroporae]
MRKMLLPALAAALMLGAAAAPAMAQGYYVGPAAPYAAWNDHAWAGYDRANARFANQQARADFQAGRMNAAVGNYGAAAADFQAGRAANWQAANERADARWNDARAAWANRPVMRWGW